MKVKYIIMIVLAAIVACISVSFLVRYALAHTSSQEKRAVDILNESLVSPISYKDVKVVGTPHFTEGMGVDFYARYKAQNAVIDKLLSRSPFADCISSRSVKSYVCREWTDKLDPKDTFSTNTPRDLQDDGLLCASLNRYSGDVLLDGRLVCINKHTQEIWFSLAAFGR